MDRGTWVDGTIADKTLIGDLIDDYICAVASKRRCPAELSRLARFKETIGELSVSALTPGMLLAWRDSRLEAVSPGTVAREMGLLGGMLTWARKERLVPMPHNPISAVSAPVVNDARERRVGTDELTLLLATMEDQSAGTTGGTKRRGTYRVGSRSLWLRPAVELALETAMRQGELLSLDWANIDFAEQTAFLPSTKNGEPRTVPLSRRAVSILESLKSSDSNYGLVFPVTANALKKAWSRAISRARKIHEAQCKETGRRAGRTLVDLRFHDLRHEATSRLAEKLSNVLELAAVTGHKDLRMLKRYYHPRASDLAKKLG